METGLRYMLINNKIDDLTRMFQLFQRVDPDHRILTTGLSAHIQSIGKEINGGLASPTDKGKEPETTATPADSLQAALKWVELVLNLKAKHDNILAEAFDN